MTATNPTQPETPTVDDAAAGAIKAMVTAVEQYGNQTDPTRAEPIHAASDTLAQLLPGWGPDAATMPWQRDEEYYYEDHPTAGWHTSAVDVVYAAHQMTWGELTISRLAARYTDLATATNELATFHPDYNSDTGLIPD